MMIIITHKETDTWPTLVGYVTWPALVWSLVEQFTCKPAAERSNWLISPWLATVVECLQLRFGRCFWASSLAGSSLNFGDEVDACSGRHTSLHLRCNNQCFHFCWSPANGGPATNKTQYISAFFLFHLRLWCGGAIIII